MSCWGIGKGNISFWTTNWCGEILNVSRNTSLTVRDGLNDLRSIEHLLTYEQLDKIRLVVISPQEEDKLRFLYTSTGKFSLGSYITAVRTLHVVSGSVLLVESLPERSSV